MNEATQTMQQPTAQTADGQAPEMADIEARYFAPANLTDAQVVLDNVNATCAANGVTPKYNFDATADFPVGYGLSILPINKRTADRGNETIGVLIAATPAPETVAAFDGGSDWINRVILDSITAKLRNSVRPRNETGAVAASIPFSIVDFITSQRAGEALATYKAISKVFVAALKKKGLKIMTAAILRQSLSCAEFAEQTFPNVPQDTWQSILDTMVAHATKDGLDPSCLNTWKETRDSVEVELEDIDFSDLEI